MRNAGGIRPDDSLSFHRSGEQALSLRVVMFQDCGLKDLFPRARGRAKSPPDRRFEATRLQMIQVLSTRLRYATLLDARWGPTESARKACRPRLRKPWTYEFRFADPSRSRSSFRHVLTILALGGVGLAVLFPLTLGLQVLTVAYPQAWVLIYAAAWVLTTATGFASRS